MSLCERQLGNKRIKRRHELFECEIQLNEGLITRQLMANFTAEVIKYLLYDRQQVPFPLSANNPSWHQLNDKSIAKQLSPKEQLILVTIEELMKVLNELICIMSLNDIPIDGVLLCLGQTIQMPKELYCIQMPTQDIYTVRHTADCPSVTVRSAVTRFFKTILNDKNIFENCKDIGVNKMFVLFNVNKQYAKQVMNHSVQCHQTDQLFTPLIDYRVPTFGNKFKLNINQKQCNCSPLSDKAFTILDQSVAQEVVDNCLAEDLSKTMTDVLTLEDTDIQVTVNDTTDEFIWFQIGSSIKGVQYNQNNNNKSLLSI